MVSSGVNFKPSISLTSIVGTVWVRLVASGTASNSRLQRPDAQLRFHGVFQNQSQPLSRAILIEPLT